MIINELIKGAKRMDWGEWVDAARDFTVLVEVVAFCNHRIHHSL